LDRLVHVTLPYFLRDAKKLCINSSLALVGGGFQGFLADHASLQGLAVALTIAVPEVTSNPGFLWMTVPKLRTAFCISGTAGNVVEISGRGPIGKSWAATSAVSRSKEAGMCGRYQ